VLREIHPHELQIRLGPKSGGSCEPPRKGAHANPELLGQSSDLDRVVKMCVDVLLYIAHDHVIVRSPSDRREVGQLAASGVNEEGLSGKVGPFPAAEALDQIEG